MNIFLCRFVWFGLLLLLLLLGLAWVFAVLLVNVYGIDSVVTGWIFMAACIALVKLNASIIWMH